MPSVTTFRIRYSRVALVVVAWIFAELVRYLYVIVFASHGLYDYMGIRALPVSSGVQGLFQLLAVAPALWLPVHLRRPSDMVQLFLYYAVHVPTCVLLPIVSYSSLAHQLGFAVAILLGLMSLSLRDYVPRLRLPHIRLSASLFWSCVAMFYVGAVIVFARTGYLMLSNFAPLEVYEQRLELTQRANELGSAFFYIANWTGAAVAPFLIIAGLHKRRILLVLAGVAIATMSFMASSNKANYLAVPAVMAGYAVFRLTNGRHIAAIMGASFVVLVPLLLCVDALIRSATGTELSVATWTVFHRAFTNNGFLSAIYLDLFESVGPAFYTDSFMRWFSGARFELPMAQLAGASFTHVPDVHANANMWADGYANFGYVGIAFAAVSALLVLWIYDHLSVRKNLAVATSALVVPATILANTSVHTALLSNGVIVIFLLVWLWRGADERLVT